MGGSTRESEMSPLDSGTPHGDFEPLETPKLDTKLSFRQLSVASAWQRENIMDGLSSQEAGELIEKFGRNEIPPQMTPWWKTLLHQFTGPLPFMIELAAIVAASIEDWADFGIILAILFVNGALGFFEERKAAEAVASLADAVTHEVNVKRDGKFCNIDAALLVPGDIVFLKAGQIIPADCSFLEGDDMLVDQAALTGESLPVKIPHDSEDGDVEGGKILLSGAVVKQGECKAIVEFTGFNTMIGEAAAALQNDEGPTKGLFYSRIEKVVLILVALTLVDVAVILILQLGSRGESAEASLATVLSIVIAAVPVALPLVVKVTLSVGAKLLATEHGAIVTHLPALDEIAAMRILCSDKTGTLTTAKMSVYVDRAWTAPGISKAMLMQYAALASNRANTDDAIDSAIFRAFDSVDACEKERERINNFEVTNTVGFNPIVKRTVAYLKDTTNGNTLKIGKGLVNKILCTGNDGGDEWVCEGYETLRDEIEQVDKAFSTAGYKTLGVAMAMNDGPMKFIGLIPMLDPPRIDTAETIAKIRNDGIEVKMCTGDHLNIAKELSRQISLGTNIYPNTKLWPVSAARDELILHADGFAQVLPKDKHEVVAVLQSQGFVVGMTGDGVNDAPALSRAQIGIAVAGATDAAQSAADIILTQPGLSPIYIAIVEARRIFGRMKSYILYRLAASVQIVVVLSVLIYAENQPINALYVILLALANDLSTLFIAYDFADPSPRPVDPVVGNILIMSVSFGMIEFLSSIVFYYWNLSPESGFLDAEFYDGGDGDDDVAPGTSYLQSAMITQIWIGIELLIFSTRTRSFFFRSAPAPALGASILMAEIFITLFTGFGIIFPQLEWRDIGFIWVYNLAWFFFIDVFKVLLVQAVDNPADFTLKGLYETAMNKRTPVKEQEALAATGQGSERQSLVQRTPRYSGRQTYAHQSLQRTPRDSGRQTFSGRPSIGSTYGLGSTAAPTNRRQVHMPRTPGFFRSFFVTSLHHSEHIHQHTPSTNLVDHL